MNDSRKYSTILVKKNIFHNSSITVIEVPAIINSLFLLFVCLFVCLVALRPKSTAMVMTGRSVHLATFFPGQA